VKLLIVLSLFLSVAAAQAHEGHDHGAPPAPAAGSVAPRFEARTDVFELVGVLAGADLILYLDRADSNAPVDGAEIEFESGAFKAKAQRIDVGTYRVQAGPLATAGKHALTLSAQAGDDADLLTATFDNALPAGAVTMADDSKGWPWRWLAGAALLLAAAGALMIRRRRK